MRKLSAIVLAFIVGTITSLSANEGSDEIVVEKQRDQKRLSGGEWNVQISRSYRFGKSLDGNDDVRAMGKETSYKFCLKDTEFEIFVRKLVGDGRSGTATTTVCRPMTTEIRSGRIRARQICDGGNVTIPDAEDHTFRTYKTRLVLDVNGTFDLDSLKIDFQNSRELTVSDSSQIMHPDLMRWSITGERNGECALD